MWHIEHPGVISRDLAGVYADNLRRGVQRVFGSLDPADPFFDINANAQANVARFGAHKALWIARTTDRLRTVAQGSDLARKTAAMIRTANRYQLAEYQVAVSRSRTAKQWREFNDPERGRYIPTCDG